MTTRKTGQLSALALGFAASLVVYSELFGPYLTWKDEPQFIKILTLFLMPVTAAVISLLLGSLQRRPVTGGDHTAADAAVQDIVSCVIFFLIGLHIILLAVLMQVGWVGPWAGRGVVMLVGATLVAVGNLLPRTRPNVALGIRTSRTLADRQLWMLTHRTSGYIAVAVGAITMFTAAFVTRSHIAAVPGTSGIVGMAVIFACYWKFARGSTSVKEV